MFDRLIASSFGLSMLLAASLGAQTADSEMRAIAGRLENVSQQFQSDSGLSLTELSKIALQLEDILGEMRAVERDYGQERAAVEARFREESKELSALLGYIVTLRATTAPDFMLHPEGARGAIEANMLVENMMPQLEAKLADVGSDLQELRSIIEAQETLHNSSREAMDQVNALRAQIIENDRAGVPTIVADSPDALDSIFAVSDNLDEFIRKIDQVEGIAIPETVKIEDMKGALFWPATGNRQAVRDGELITTSQTIIATPIAGTVRFAKEFREYGNTLIIEPERDYLFIMSGFDQIVAKEGEILEAGDVVGYFARIQAENRDKEEMTLAAPSHELYLELRKNSRAVSLSEYFSETSE